jgi:hypothetical protein
LNSQEIEQRRNAHRHFLSDHMRIQYYCSDRKKHFTNTVKVDLDLGVQRKLNGVKFKLLPAVNEHNTKTLVIQSIDGRHQLIGDACSVPAYLFGPEYYFARRKDVSNIFDFRKSAFEPIPNGAKLYADRFGQ